MRSLICAIIVFITAGIAVGQDKIIKRDKSVIECNIIEVGTTEIRYKLSDEEGFPIIAISVDEVYKIIFRNGREMSFYDPMNDLQVYHSDRKRIIKFHFLSPLAGHLGFSYENSIKPGRSFESELGIIGVGYDFDEFEKSSGFFISGGYKFMKTPDFYLQKMKYAHILKGSYIKPQVLISFYSVEGTDPFFTNPVSYDNSYFTGVFLLNIGKQHIFDNIFALDYSIGVGYGFTIENETTVGAPYYYENYRTYHYGFVGGENDFPLAISGRIKIGVLLN